jgi:hypothetical protein
MEKAMEASGVTLVRSISISCTAASRLRALLVLLLALVFVSAIDAKLLGRELPPRMSFLRNLTDNSLRLIIVVSKQSA